MIPSSAKIYAAPCSLADLRRSTVDYWSHVYGFDMSILSKEALKRTKPEVAVIKQDQLLADPEVILRLDLSSITSDELSNIASKKFVSVNKNAKLQGIALWFDIHFDHFGIEGWKSVCLDTSPSSLPTHWKQTVIPLFRDLSDEHDEDVEEDDIVGFQLSLTRMYQARQYGIQVELLDPAQVEHPVPCDCKSAKCTLINALLAQEDEYDELDAELESVECK